MRIPIGWNRCVDDLEEKGFQASLVGTIVDRSSAWTRAIDSLAEQGFQAEVAGRRRGSPVGAKPGAGAAKAPGSMGVALIDLCVTWERGKARVAIRVPGEPPRPAPETFDSAFAELASRVRTLLGKGFRSFEVSYDDASAMKLASGAAGLICAAQGNLRMRFAPPKASPGEGSRAGERRGKGTAARVGGLGAVC
ncbi:MAG: hypothetical protein HYZ53_23685 [Planctomycetes bacterium]|nr:hypothetical protein [Planctomycetota bacterium]